ncbi:hypothetical protein NYR55_09305 [Sphingomonas sp. BGYR3]|uniref:hypothetical protein n=1 Tax=Sphingomonas sp. BGYR3 TaxID=2975483 RepID=UPI0021A70479|nr:hypothetical protein [Sphingomonas sp. BGYR3]MDG5488813.1 hypothetical protein [Sphingomonas sp. BGYR3]
MMTTGMLLAGLVSTARAEELALESIEPCDDATLDAQRGGFVIGGMTISLGADMRTYLNGDLVMQTTVRWQDGGAQTERWVSAALTPATAEQLQTGFIETGTLRLSVGSQPVFLANAGQTALIQRTDGGIQNIVLNTASATAMRQEMDVALDVTGYQPFGDVIGQASLAGNLNDTIARLSISAARF